MSDIATLLKYFAKILETGDPQNTWLNYLPVDIQGATLILGEWLANILGF